jgi:hypothetical protein
MTDIEKLVIVSLSIAIAAVITTISAFVVPYQARATIRVAAPRPALHWHYGNCDLINRNCIIG